MSDPCASCCCPSSCPFMCSVHYDMCVHIEGFVIWWRVAWSACVNSLRGCGWCCSWETYLNKTYIIKLNFRSDDICRGLCRIDVGCAQCPVRLSTSGLGRSVSQSRSTYAQSQFVCSVGWKRILSLSNPILQNQILFSPTGIRKIND